MNNPNRPKSHFRIPEKSIQILMRKCKGVTKQEINWLYTHMEQEKTSNQYFHPFIFLIYRNTPQKLHRDILRVVYYYHRVENKPITLEGIKKTFNLIKNKDSPNRDIITTIRKYAKIAGQKVLTTEGYLKKSLSIMKQEGKLLVQKEKNNSYYTTAVDPTLRKWPKGTIVDYTLNSRTQKQSEKDFAKVNPIDIIPLPSDYSETPLTAIYNYQSLTENEIEEIRKYTKKIEYILLKRFILQKHDYTKKNARKMCKLLKGNINNMNKEYYKELAKLALYDGLKRPAVVINTFREFNMMECFPNIASDMGDFIGYTEQDIDNIILPLLEKNDYESISQLNRYKLPQSE